MPPAMQISKRMNKKCLLLKFGIPDGGKSQNPTIPQSAI